MSKKNQAAQNDLPSIELVVMDQVVSQTKTYPIPIDGSKGPDYIKEHGGVSKSIRILTDQGFSRGEVAKMLDKRYQHVRNVLITPVKKAS